MDKKRARKICPGCKLSFSSRHFYDHKKDNFTGSSWYCEKHKKQVKHVFDDKHLHVSSSDEEPNFDAEFLKARIEEKHGGYGEDDYDHDAFEVNDLGTNSVPDYLLEFQDSPQASQDEEDQLGNEDYDEQWEEIKSEEVERDVSFFTIESPQSQKHSSLLLIKWICTFICFWQAMCCLPDSAVEWLLKF